MIQKVPFPQWGGTHKGAALYAGLMQTCSLLNILSERRDHQGLHGQILPKRRGHSSGFVPGDRLCPVAVGLSQRAEAGRLRLPTRGRVDTGEGVHSLEQFIALCLILFLLVDVTERVVIRNYSPT